MLKNLFKKISFYFEYYKDYLIFIYIFISVMLGFYMRALFLLFIYLFVYFYKNVLVKTEFFSIIDEDQKTQSFHWENDKDLKVLRIFILFIRYSTVFLFFLLYLKQHFVKKQFVQNEYGIYLLLFVFLFSILLELVGSYHIVYYRNPSSKYPLISFFVKFFKLFPYAVGAALSTIGYSAYREDITPNPLTNALRATIGEVKLYSTEDHVLFNSIKGFLYTHPEILKEFITDKFFNSGAFYYKLNSDESFRQDLYLHLSPDQSSKLKISSISSEGIVTYQPIKELPSFKNLEPIDLESSDKQSSVITDFVKKAIKPEKK